MLKGVILAGGRGTRLSPLTEITNKHLLPVGREPMIWHSVKQLTGAGIKDIIIITSTQHMGDIVNSLGSGSRFDCEFTYRVQEEPAGIAHALALCESFVNHQKMVVLLADNIFDQPITPYVHEFLTQEDGGKVLLKQVGEPERFGVAALDETQIIEIQEKPSNPKSNFAVVGCYMYDQAVFSYIRDCKPSQRGELEITSVNNIYIQNKKLSYSIVSGKWTDAGTFESLMEANKIIFERKGY